MKKKKKTHTARKYRIPTTVVSNTHYRGIKYQKPWYRIPTTVVSNTNYRGIEYLGIDIHPPLPSFSGEGDGRIQWLGSNHVILPIGSQMFLKRNMKHKLKCESQTSSGIFTCPWKYSAPVLTPACIIAMSCPVISANNTSTSSSLLLSCDNSFHRSAPPSTYCAHFSQ